MIRGDGASRLNVVGSSCNLQNHPRTLQVKNGTRKLFIDGFFSTENKREIANHYRSSKKRRLNCRRKSSVKCVKQDNKSEMMRREVFQIPCFVYPRFSEVYPWRGRSSLCKSNPPDGLLNDFVKRIQIASTLDELKRLSDYQIKFIKYPLDHRRNHSFDTTNPSITQKIQLNNLNRLKSLKQTSQKKSVLNTRRPREKRKLGDIESEFPTVDTTGITDWPIVLGNGQIVSDTINYTRLKINNNNNNSNSNNPSRNESIIPLASDCYDEGLLTHLRYLEKVAERKASDEEESDSNNSNTTRDLFSLKLNREEFSRVNVRNPPRNLFLTTARNIVNIKRPLNNRNRRKNLRNFEDNSLITLPSLLQQSVDCRIRVEIKSAVNRVNRIFPTEQRPNTVSFQSVHIDTSPRIPIIPNNNGNRSMRSFEITPDNNYRYGTFASRLQLNGNRSSVDTTLEAVDRNDNINELINSLYRLDLATELGSLPKIILTDFSSSHETSATSTPSFIVTRPSSSQQKQQQQIGSSKPLNFVDFAEFNRRLSLPNETNYRSEARPP